VGDMRQSIGAGHRAQYLDWTLAASAIVGVAIVAAPSAGAAELAQVRCGEVITRSVIVANDLSNCAEHGLVIGADGITIDLNGRTIDGVGLGVGVLNDGFDRVGVVDGLVREFDTGVQLSSGAANNHVAGWRHELNQEAAVLISAGGAGTEIRENEFTANALAVGLVEGTIGAAVRDNTVGDGGGSGLEIVGAHNNIIERNQFGVSSDGAIVLEHASHNTLIENEVSGVSDAAMSVTTESNGNRIEGNVLSDSDGHHRRGLRGQSGVRQRGQRNE
jgi:parallel beta-helix repeat protein